ncbi:LysM peptidoglycan-binding domain-containing protein [Paenibacillus alkaliterrae]|uniref:cell division suppressor protein YneA n=1 Tax=Paenibacillus alkaliterrae TaxID=320909 RepID=UPI001F22AA9B|nr:LysM peptidoglycan-binding domain-containing protein [Paenibacillus alkaliterrae]MCF2938303.1 LysM peptidoglycan-binding domain-containing protein [Paenibacillus alkaliterrae]
MSPSFYRTIHKREERNTVEKWSGNAALWIKRHAAKIMVSLAVFVLLFTSFLMMGTDASSTTPAAASPQEQVITVSAGDTLWEIAKKYGNGSEDIRFVIYLIKDRNGLESVDIIPGQKLIIPSI